MIASSIRVLEWINERVGRIVSWLILLLVLNTFAVGILRYGFSLGWVWLQESYVWMHGTVIMVASGYALLHDSHVRIDLVYRGMTPGKRAWVNLLGVSLLLVPTLAVVWWAAYPYVMLSWERLESSRDSGGLAGLFLWKTSMLVFVVLLAFQGLALALRSILVLQGHEEWDPSQRFE